MNADSSWPVEDRLESNSGVAPLLSTNIRSRYQAYCATEVSSRPSSPDTLTPGPLHIQSSLIEKRDVEPDTERQTNVTQPPATSTEYQEDLATLSKRKNQCYEQRFSTNESPTSRHSELGIDNHIAQAVTPRGSHPLAGSQTPVYNRTPSHSRMQPIRQIHVPTSQPIPRKPVLQHENEAYMDRHPLPPLPAEIPVENNLVQPEILSLKRPISNEEVLTEATQSRPRLTWTVWGIPTRRPVVPAHHSGEISPRSATIPADTVPLSGSHSRSVTPEAESQHRGVMVPNNDALCRVASTKHKPGGLINEHAQFPSSVELYTPRGLFLDLEDDRRAHRRTQPKDTKLRYQFGQRPSPHSPSPPRVPARRQLSESLQRLASSESHGQTDCHDYYNLKSQTESFNSFTEAQLGPRPPPWGSYDNLEMQRRSRGDLREREEARKYRMIMDGSSTVSLHITSGSEDGFIKNPWRREVEEYREQVLHLYPDMEFDGTAGNGGRMWWCWGCVIM